MKKKVLLSSIGTIALCLCLLVGSTFALFTSQSDFDIAVTSGKVDVVAGVVDLERYSAAKVAGTNESAQMVDENGKGYYYNGPLAAFTNGGTAEYVDGKLTLNKVTPGDKVVFTVKADNNSDVAILYRVKVACTKGEFLMTGLNVKFGNEVATTGLTSYVSAWTATTVNGEDIPDIPVEIELPITAGNAYQELTAELVVTLEAVQGNADMDDESELDTTEIAFRVTNDEELAAALETIYADSTYWNTPVSVYLAEGEYSGDHTVKQYPAWNGLLGQSSNVNGKSGMADVTHLSFIAEGAVSFTGNVTVVGFGSASNGFVSARATTLFEGVTFDAANSVEANGTHYVAAYVTAAASGVTYDGCTFKNGTHVTVGNSGANGVGAVTFTGCDFIDGNCISGYCETLTVTDCTATNAYKGFISNQKAGTVTVSGCTVDCSEYAFRTQNSGINITVTDSAFDIAAVTDGQYLVNFRGSGHTATFTGCTFNVDTVTANGTLTIN